jgi:formamidopyrimidine-DNA glycosylase
MDQSVIAGIGNIYADESLWRAGIHPLTQVQDISEHLRKELFEAIIQTLSRGIDLGGDSTSDYRNVDGERGAFHEQHYAYRQTDTACQKKGCSGTIVRIVLGGRGTHFCSMHQKTGDFTYPTIYTKISP